MQDFLSTIAALRREIAAKEEEIRKVEQRYRLSNLYAGTPADVALAQAGYTGAKYERFLDEHAGVVLAFNAVCDYVASHERELAVKNAFAASHFVNDDQVVVERGGATSQRFDLQVEPILSADRQPGC